MCMWGRGDVVGVCILYNFMCLLFIAVFRMDFFFLSEPGAAPLELQAKK